MVGFTGKKTPQPFSLLLDTDYYERNMDFRQIQAAPRDAEIGFSSAGGVPRRRGCNHFCGTQDL
jgi:hypothetical protein